MRERAGTEDGVWHLPDGDAYYAWTVRLHTTTDRTPQEIHERGLAEVARIQGEMREILRAEGIPAHDLAQTIRELGRDPRFLYPDTDEGRKQILADYQAIIDDASARLPALFGRLPRARVVVERVPAFKEEGAARGVLRDRRPSTARSRASSTRTCATRPSTRSSGCARSPITRRSPGTTSRSRSPRS